jgi:hypothetical protein
LPDHISPRLADEAVLSGAAIEDVVARPSEERVISRPVEECVVPGVAAEDSFPP